MGNSQSDKINPVQAPELQGLSGDILSHATSFLNNSSGAIPQQTVVGYNPYQQNTMSQLQSALGTQNPIMGSASNYVGDVLNGKYLDPSTNPALAASGAAASSGAQRLLNQNLDQIGANFALAGGSSSSAMANAKKSAVTATAGNLGQTLANLYGGAYQNERGNQNSALWQAPGISQAPVNQLMMALGLGGQQQAQSQAMANLPLQNFLTQMGIQGQGLSGALGALQGVGSTFMMPQYAPSELSQNLGLAFQGANSAGNLIGALRGGK